MLGKRSCCLRAADKQNTSLANPPRKSIDSTASKGWYLLWLRVASYPVFCLSDALALIIRNVWQPTAVQPLWHEILSKVQFDTSRSKGRRNLKVRYDAVRSMPLLFHLKHCRIRQSGFRIKWDEGWMKNPTWKKGHSPCTDQDMNIWHTFYDYDVTRIGSIATITSFFLECRVPSVHNVLSSGSPGRSPPSCKSKRYSKRDLSMQKLSHTFDIGTNSDIFLNKKGGFCLMRCHSLTETSKRAFGWIY